MYYDRIEAYYKGSEYAAEADKYIRRIDEQHIRFQGRHGDHQLQLVNGSWVCDCESFAKYAVPSKVRPHLAALCAHTIAVEKVCAKQLGLTA